MKATFFRAAAWCLAASAAPLAAHAATDSIAVPSLIDNVRSVEFQFMPVSALENSPVHLYVSGYVGGYLRCRNQDGCGSFRLAASIDFSAFVAGAGLGGTISTRLVDYGASEYGDFIDLTPLKFSTDPRTLEYWEAVNSRVVKSEMTGSDPYTGRLETFNSQLLMIDGHYADFDFVTVGLLTPKVNIHYVASPLSGITPSDVAVVPEPGTSVMVLLGLAGIAAALRRRG